jgi:ferredoxin
MATVALLSLRGGLEPGLALAGTDLCVGCGACERHCFWHIDISSRLVAFRAEQGEPAPALAVPTISAAPASDTPVFRTCYEGSTGKDGQLACCGGREAFIERQPVAAAEMAREVVARMEGNPHRCNISTCASWLARHGAVIEEEAHARTIPPN